MEEANRLLTLAEAGTRKHLKVKKHTENHRFHPGLEWEILNVDAVVLLGLIHALRYVSHVLPKKYSLIVFNQQRVIYGLSSVPVRYGSVLVPTFQSHHQPSYALNSLVNFIIN